MPKNAQPPPEQKWKDRFTDVEVFLLRAAATASLLLTLAKIFWAEIKEITNW